MKPISLLLGALLLGSAALPASLAYAQEGPCQSNPSPVDAADPNIIVDSPTANTSLASPITVTGQARTFESNVRVTLFDSAGNELADTFGTAVAPDVGQHGPFSIDISFSVSAPTEACLWVFEDSPETGDPVSVVQIPLTLTAAAGLPSTGSGLSGISSQRAAVLMLSGFALAASGLSAVGWSLRRPVR
jgi:hypothetical protein